MKEWHDISSAEELELSGQVVARIQGREVGIVRDPTDGSLHGLRNRCPHHGGPLCLGTVRERVAGSPGRYELVGQSVLRCPWHGWEFDPATGQCLDEPSMRVAVYPAKAEGDRVLIDI